MQLTQEQKELLDKCLTHTINANKFFVDTVIKDYPRMAEEKESIEKETKAIEDLKEKLWE